MIDWNKALNCALVVSFIMFMGGVFSLCFIHLNPWFAFTLSMLMVFLIMLVVKECEGL